MTLPGKDSRTAGYQEWRHLTFLHWRVSASELRQLIPPSLTIQEFDGSAWLGIVPFSMERIRPWWFPPVPGISWFLETNVRTYVVDENGVSGVWFMSLDANKRLAVNVACTFWHLPYKFADLSLNHQTRPRGSSAAPPEQFVYSGRRREVPPADYEISVRISEHDAKPAVAGTLEYFLVERYLLFAARRDGSIMTGQVHHEPYQLRSVDQVEVRQSLTNAGGCHSCGSQPDHVAFSDGVKVRVSPLK
jgi:uncharacterized protein